MSEDLSPHLLGRGMYGPQRLPLVRGPQHLWNHVTVPPAQNSLLIYKDGTVVEGNNFESWQVSDPNVHRFIYGGSKVTEDTIDEFSLNALVAAGYTFGFGATLDVYTPEYTDEYPLVEGDVIDDAAAAAEAVRLARIAALEAELAELRGTT